MNKPVRIRFSKEQVVKAFIKGCEEGYKGKIKVLYEQTNLQKNTGTSG